MSESPLTTTSNPANLPKSVKNDPQNPQCFFVTNEASFLSPSLSLSPSPFPLSLCLSPSPPPPPNRVQKEKKRQERGGHGGSEGNGGRESEESEKEGEKNQHFGWVIALNFSWGCCGERWWRRCCCWWCWWCWWCYLFEEYWTQYQT